MTKMQPARVAKSYTPSQKALILEDAAKNGVTESSKEHGVRWARASVGWTLGCVLCAAPARGESSMSCMSASIVEIFSGTAEAPDADYVVVARNSGCGDTVDVLEHCGAWVGRVGSRTGACGSATVLIAHPHAEALFGIQADVIATGRVPQPDGHLQYSCGAASAKLAYGAYSKDGVPALVPGKALKRVGSSWVLGEPTPRNSSGDLGALDGSASDAALDVDASAHDAGFEAADAAPLPPCPRGTGGSPGAGGSGPKDASPDLDAAAAAEGESAGCACRASAPGTRMAELWLAVLAAMALRRRASPRAPARRC
jgi:hypothetical protein